MTDTSTTPTSTSPDPATPAQVAPSVAKVLAALVRLGQDTAAAIAAEAGLGYSTTTPKLRLLENQGLAEPVRGGDGRTLWRPTDAGCAHGEQLSEPDPAGTLPSTAEPTAAEASGTTTPSAEEIQRNGAADGTSESPDNAPARPDGSDEGPAGISQPAAPSGPAGPAATAAEPAPANADDPQPPTTGGEPAAVSGTAPADAAEPAAGAPQTGDAASDTGTDGTQAPDTAPAEPVAEPAGTDSRRASGTLRGAILDILEANPGQRYKVSELCRLIDKANEGSGVKKASAGAVHNAATKLAEAGRVVLAVEKPATFALTGADAGSNTTN
jgi:DNA-binding MarR family transcriptional regulator